MKIEVSELIYKVSMFLLIIVGSFIVTKYISKVFKKKEKIT